MAAKTANLYARIDPETKEQAELLMNYGSYKAQGYYYYKPMPMVEFEQLLIKQQKQ